MLSISWSPRLAAADITICPPSPPAGTPLQRLGRLEWEAAGDVDCRAHGAVGADDRPGAATSSATTAVAGDGAAEPSTNLLLSRSAATTMRSSPKEGGFLIMAKMLGLKSVRIGAALALFLAMSAVFLAQRSDAASKTRRLEGFMSNIQNFSGPDCPSFVCSSFQARGVLNGPGVVVVESFSPAFEFPEAVSRAHTTIHDIHGDVFCSDLAIFDLAEGDHPFVDQCMITGGTGRYEGATGYIQEVGVFNFEANRGEAHYHGKIILS